MERWRGDVVACLRVDATPWVWDTIIIDRHLVLRQVNDGRDNRIEPL